MLALLFVNTEHTMLNFLLLLSVTAFVRVHSSTTASTASTPSAATTTAIPVLAVSTRHVKDTNEHNSFHFYYDHTSGNMLMIGHSSCYVLALTDAERIAVHDPVNIETLELQLMALVANPASQSPVDKTTAPSFITHHCRHRNVFNLTRA
ncbi:uncharacterized protein LOC124136842 [Haliotis rufescens]|uniref:uncharacterized protein LOC124136842 n=1 Tax=Haliotis rufescens TaxID=6454 RepID=UPI00201F2B1B|nr:uncharacterized protein LOC124136842 [Haliotis rufescens]